MPRTMNRGERQRYAADLRRLAATGVRLSDVGPVEGTWTCDCTACRLARAGVCMTCAATITAQVIEGGPGAIRVKPCSPACREGVERWVAEKKAAR